MVVGCWNAGEQGWEAVMFTIEELATDSALLGSSRRKRWSTLPAKWRTSTSPPGSMWPTRAKVRALAIVVEGKAELTKLVNGVEQVIGVRLPGELGGEIPMTLGTPLPASMRAVEPSRVLKVTVEVFHTLAAMAPEVSAAVGAAALERIEMLKNATAQPLEPAMFVIGPRLDPGVHSVTVSCTATRFPTNAWTRTIPRAVARTGANRRGRPAIRWCCFATALG